MQDEQNDLTTEPINVSDDSSKSELKDETSTGSDDDMARQLAESQEEARTNLSGWQRAQADFANYKTREEAKQKDLLDFAKEVTVVKMLPTLDSMEQGMLHIPESSEPDFESKFAKWKSGMEGVQQKLEKVLEEMGIKKIDAIGKQFDPHFHEAIREVPGDADGIVMGEVQIGYEINGKVIRPSQVIISKKGA